MKTRIIDQDIWLELGPSDIWKHYNNLNYIIRGSGNSTSAKLDKYRQRDLSIEYNTTGEVIICPSPTKGISFATTLERLESIPIRGYVWKLPKNSRIPEGLIFNVKDKDHPLLNVSRKMSENEFLIKLKDLSRHMVKTNYKI